MSERAGTERVSASEIDEQRDKNWRDFHPEKFCHRCGRLNVWSWSAPSPLWNAVMRDRATGQDKFGIVCPPCFSQLAETVLGPMVHWYFQPEGVDVAPLWTDPDGRVWDAGTQLWSDPEGPEPE